MERVVDIYTDGACHGNPGPGGWGAVLRYGGSEKELYGGTVEATTNNRMELMAPIRALESLTRPVAVRVHTDSTYVRDGITQWIRRWKANGWQTTGRRPVKNVDLWQRLDCAVAGHDVSWHWVKGHAGHPDNERADRLAAHGLGEALLAAGRTAPPAGPAVPVQPPDRRTAPPATRHPAPPTQRRESGPDTGRDTGTCRATTRTGAPCRTGARPSGLCHLHDPAVQCGATTKKGQRCTTATGGGRCTYHQDAAPHPVAAAQDTPLF